MMAAYQPTTGMQQGMAPHGHPAMTPGHPMNSAAQMQQMSHPGVSGPGQPHVSQAGAMMAMQPGVNGMAGPLGMGGQHPGGQMGGMPGQMGGQSMAGGAPNTHAMSHLTPQAAMQQQQLMQQQQFQQNPQLAQQASIRRQQVMALHAQANGGMAGMQHAGMPNMSQQQMQQLQQNNHSMQPQQVALPQHLLAQQQHLRAQQAQHSQQMQQQLAMQHGNSQQGNQGGQPVPPNQQGGQAQQPGQMRPQSRMANPNQQNQGDPQHTPQQGGQGQQSQQQGQQNQQQSQQQNQQGQQQPLNPQQMQALQQQRQRQMQYQQQLSLQQQTNQMRQPTNQANQQAQQQSGAFILRLMLFGDQLSNFDDSNGKDIGEWHTFVDRHFAPDGRFLHSFTLRNGNQKTYEVPRQTIAQYFQMYFDSGARSVRLHTEHSREQQMPQGRHSVSFSGATLTVAYPNGARLEMSGSMNVLFAPGSDMFECLEIQTSDSQETIMRSEIERILTNWSPTMSNKASPKLTKTKLPKAQQKMQSQLEGLTIEHFPKAPTRGELGVTTRVQQFLEIGETMNIMSELICFAEDRGMRPIEATEALIAQYDAQGQGQQAGQQQQQQGNPQINLPATNGIPMGARTPSMGNMQMPNQFSSPSVSNLSLPMQNVRPGGIMNGSPHLSNNPGLTAPNMAMQTSNSHTPSPHQSNMAAPPMMPQLSQQGTNSSAASANTSPNVSGKRRRSQGVKMEGDEGGGDASQQGGGKVRPSPRVGKKAKP